jgi:hypothetical protein
MTVQKPGGIMSRGRRIVKKSGIPLGAMVKPNFTARTAGNVERVVFAKWNKRESMLQFERRKCKMGEHAEI